MKKRLAKKALSSKYFDVWVKPGVDKVIHVPRNARCWCIFQRACYYVGHPEFITTFVDNIMNTLTTDK